MKLQNKKRGFLQAGFPYAYIMPICLVLLVFVTFSVILSVILSFTKYNILTPPEFAGLYNYTRLLEDTKLKTSIANTLKLIIMIVPIQTVMAIFMSVLLAAKRNTFLGKLTNAVIFIPVISSSAVAGTVWKGLLNGHIKIVELFFGFFGVDPAMLLGSSKTALATVAMISIWKNLGYYTIIYLSSVLSIPGSYYEAAKVDGATKWQEFFHITLPLLMPTTILALFLGITSSLQSFDIIYNLTGGGPSMSTTTLVFYTYNLCFSNGKAGYAMAVSNVLFAIILITVIMQKRFMKRDLSEI